MSDSTQAFSAFFFFFANDLNVLQQRSLRMCLLHRTKVKETQTVKLPVNIVGHPAVKNANIFWAGGALKAEGKSDLHMSSGGKHILFWRVTSP